MKIIKNEKEHKTAIRTMERLLRIAPHDSSIGVLALVIEDYEKKRFPIKTPSILEAVKFRMEQQNLKRKDLIKMGIFGGRGKASDFFSGRRPLSLNQRRGMRIHLGIPADILLQ